MRGVVHRCSVAAAAPAQLVQGAPAAQLQPLARSARVCTHVQGSTAQQYQVLQVPAGTWVQVRTWCVAPVVLYLQYRYQCTGALYLGYMSTCTISTSTNCTISTSTICTISTSTWGTSTTSSTSTSCTITTSTSIYCTSNTISTTINSTTISCNNSGFTIINTATQCIALQGTWAPADGISWFKRQSLTFMILKYRFNSFRDG